MAIMVPETFEKGATMTERRVLPLKSLAGALLFAVLLGPIGLLYASSVGGITMIVLGFIAACSKLPIPIALVWIGSSILSVVATNRYNKKIINTL